MSNPAGPERRSRPYDEHTEALLKDLGSIAAQAGAKLAAIQGLGADIADLREDVASLNRMIERSLVPREELESKYPTMKALGEQAEKNAKGIAKAKADIIRGRKLTTFLLVVFFLASLYGGLTLSDWRTSSCYPAADSGQAALCDHVFLLAPHHKTRAENETTFLIDLGLEPSRFRATVCAAGIALPDTCRRAGLPYRTLSTTTTTTNPGG